MKRLAVCALLILAACSSSVTYPVMPPPDVEIVQLYGPSDVPYSRGVSSVEAQYGVQVTNRSAEPVTLTHVSLQSLGGGTIVMRREERGFNNVIPPGQTGQAVINARVYAFLELGSGLYALAVPWLKELRALYARLREPVAPLLVAESAARTDGVRGR